MNTLKSKKGYSMSGWTEGILLSALFVMIFAGIVVSNFNSMYSGNYEVGLGTNSTKSDFTSYQDTIQEEIMGGEVSFTETEGLTLKSIWTVLKEGMSIIWNFLTGGWIETIVSDYLKWPVEVALVFRILYFLSIGFIVIKLLFKTNP